MRSLARPLALPAMASALGAYVFVHAPLLHLMPAGAGHPRMTASALAAGAGVIPASWVDAAVAAVAIAAALAGAAVVSGWAADAHYERPLVFGVAAFAFVVVPAAFLGGLAGWTGAATLRPPLGPLLIALPAFAVTALGIACGWRPRAIPRPLNRAGGLNLALSAVALVLLGASVAMHLSRPPTGFDALSYHAPMAVYFWRDGNIVALLDRAPYGFAMAQPGAAELWFGLLSSGFGERLANLGQLPFALLGAAAVHAFSRRLGFPRRAATVAGLGFLIAPIVVLQAGVQVTDVTAAALMMAAIALASAPAAEWTRRRGGAVGLAAGLAVSVKLAVLPVAACVLAYVVLTGARAAWSGRIRIAAIWAALTLTFALAVAPWAIRNAVRFGNPVYPAALPLLGRGVVVGDFEKKDTRFVPRAAAWPLYPLIEAHSAESGLGPLLLVGAIPGLLLTMGRARHRRPLVLYLAVTATGVSAWWILTQHEPRHLLAVVGLMFAFLPAALGVVRRRLRPAAAVLLVSAALCSAALTIDRGLAPRADEPADRARFYDEVWGVDPVVAGWSTPGPLLYNTGFASLSYAGDYPLLGPSLERILLTVDTDVSTQTIVAFMKRHRAQFAYVPASPASRSIVEAKYSPEVFELAHVSSIVAGRRAGTRRYLFRLRSDSTARHDVAGAGDPPR